MSRNGRHSSYDPDNNAGSKKSCKGSSASNGWSWSKGKHQAEKQTVSAVPRFRRSSLKQMAFDWSTTEKYVELKNQFRGK